MPMYIFPASIKFNIITSTCTIRLSNQRCGRDNKAGGGGLPNQNSQPCFICKKKTVQNQCVGKRPTLHFDSEINPPIFSPRVFPPLFFFLIATLKSNNYDRNEPSLGHLRDGGSLQLGIIFSTESRTYNE